MEGNLKGKIKVGVVIIGRNEGQRLIECLDSVAISGCPIVYVDSGSIDGSVQIAKDSGVHVIKLDVSIPFSAARARNEGCAEIQKLYPLINYIQFVDGDCKLFAGWLETALFTLERDQKLAAVFGEVEEIAPLMSIYNRLCALEWQSPFGKIQNCGVFGGNSMIRTNAFRSVGGFDPQVIAGEDAELAARLLLAGYQIEKLDCPMVRHDANIIRFGQWWRRSVRSGHAIGQRAHLHGSSILKDCLRQRKSVVIWGIVVPLFAVFGSMRSLWFGIAAIILYCVLALRIWRYRTSTGNNSFEAAIYAAFTVLSKLPEAAGLLRFWVNQFFNRYRIIEYK